MNRRPAIAIGVALTVSALLASSAAPGAVPAITASAPTSRSASVARIVVGAPALSAPGRGRVVERLPTSAGSNGGPVALLVVGSRVVHATVWLRVLLPRRPNGTSAWVDSNYVEIRRTPWRIDISLEARSVRLLRGGRVVERWRAVVGKPSTPTPRGLFAVYQRVRQPDPNGFLGTWAVLLTAFSPVLRAFDGGPGQVAIHGRGGASLLDPLGSARSHGCIRIDNGAIDVLARDAAAGTPVRIS